MQGWRPRRTHEWFRKTIRVTECKLKPAAAQETCSEPVRPFLGLQGPETVRFQQTRRDKAIKVPGFKGERKQNETRFGQLLNPLGSQGSKRWKKEQYILSLYCTLSQRVEMTCWLPLKVYQLQNQFFPPPDYEESIAMRL